MAMGHDHPLGRAVVYSIVFSAVTHVAISFFVGASRGDLTTINMFHVLGFDLIWPELGKGSLNAFLAVVMIISIWAIFAALLLHFEKRHKKSPK